MVRIVASYTTLPGREETLEKSIKSLLDQTRKPDVIYLTLPEKAERLNLVYPEPSEFVKKHCKIVRIPKDYGPATKLYGALQEEQDPKTLIFSVDDDVIYDRHLIAELARRAKQFPDSAVSGTGALFRHGKIFIGTVFSMMGLPGFFSAKVPEEGRAVDALFGSAGVMYRRGMFEYGQDLDDNLWKMVFSDPERTIFHNDDMLFSAYLCKRGIERRVFAGIPKYDHLSGEAALSGDFFKMYDRTWKAIRKLQEMQYFEDEFIEANYYDTIIFKIICMTLLLILVILLIILFCFSYKSINIYDITR